MSEIALAGINTFGTTSPKADVSSEDPVLEIPVSEFQHILEDLTMTYNAVAELASITGNHDLMIARNNLANRARTLRGVV